MTRLLAAMVLVTALCACSDPRRAALPDDMGKMEAIKPQIEKLQPEERELLLAYMLRKSFKGTVFGGVAGTTDAKTVGEAIDSQREYKAERDKRDAEQAALKAKAKAEYDAAVKALSDAVTVALLGKKVDEDRGYSGMVMNRHLNITVAYQNNTDKPVAGVKGTLIVTDVFGDPLSRFHISNDQTIAPKGRVTWTGGRRLSTYSMSDNKDEKFSELPDDKYKVRWEPEAVVFSDGTKLAADKPAQ